MSFFEMTDLIKRALLCLSLGAVLFASPSLIAQTSAGDKGSPMVAPKEQPAALKMETYGNGYHTSEECEAPRCGVDCGWGKVYSYGVDNNVVDITKSLSSSIQLGQEFCLKIIATARAHSENVAIKTTIPAGAEYVDSDPGAQVVDGELIWRIDEMCCGERTCINVWFRAVELGCIESCTTVHADPVVCACTTVGQPILRVCKEGPEVVIVGNQAVYYVTVFNEGDYPAFDVVLEDHIPEGMAHSSGEDVLTFCLGTLYPCGSKTVKIPLCAVAPARNICNEAVATSCNAGEARDKACSDLLVQDISVTKEGTDKLYVCKQAGYTITVTNSGENELHNVTVVDRAPNGTHITDAPGACWDCRSAQWVVEVLAPGESRSFNISMSRQCPGCVTNRVWVNSCEGACAEACFETEWMGIPALCVDVSDVCDPVCEGDGTCYRIRVSNHGSAADSNINITARFSDELKPSEAWGYSEGKVAGQAVMFDVIEELDAGEYIEFEIHADAVKSGDGRVRVDLKSDWLKEPVSEEESTHVY